MFLRIRCWKIKVRHVGSAILMWIVATITPSSTLYERISNAWSALLNILILNRPLISIQIRGSIALEIIGRIRIMIINLIWMLVVTMLLMLTAWWLIVWYSLRKLVVRSALTCTRRIGMKRIIIFCNKMMIPVLMMLDFYYMSNPCLLCSFYTYTQFHNLHDCSLSFETRSHCCPAYGNILRMEGFQRTH